MNKLAVLITIALLGYTLAVEVDDQEDGVPHVAKPMNMSELKSSADVSVTYKFPKSLLKHFPSGEVSDILLGFHNEGPDVFVVTAIDGAYRAPHDTAHYLQNFTRLPLNQTAAPYEAASLEYKFWTHPSFEAAQLNLIVRVYYFNPKTNTSYASTAFNETVMVVDPAKSTFEFQTMSLYVIGAIAAIGTIILVKRAFRGNKKQRKAPREPSKNKSQGPDLSWIPEHNLTAQMKRNSKGTMSE